MPKSRDSYRLLTNSISKSNPPEGIKITVSRTPHGSTILDKAKLDLLEYKKITGSNACYR